MSTPFINIFQNFLALVDDGSICRGLTDEEITVRLWKYLENGYSVWFKVCQYDLTDNTMYDYYTQSHTFAGTGDTFILSQYPDNPNEDAIEMVFTVNGVDADYSFDELTLEFTTTATLQVGDEIVFGYKFSGQFNDNLTVEEQWILAHAMVLSWTSEKVREENALKNVMTTKDYVKYSPANMLNSLLEMRRKSWVELNGMVINYSFNGFNGFDE